MDGDAKALAILDALLDSDTPHSIRHFLYLPNAEAAAALTEALKDRGFEAGMQHPAGGTNWLVLAQHTAIASEALLGALRRSMDALAAEFGGAYDGWETELRPGEGGARD
jgi:hypothetical protein